MTKRCLKRRTFWLVRLHSDLPIGGCFTDGQESHFGGSYCCCILLGIPD